MADYATLAEIKADIALTDATGSDTATLNRLITAASRAIDRFCQRPDGFIAADASLRYFVGNGLPWIRIGECTTVTVVAVKSSVTDTTYTAWTAPTTNMAGDGDYYAFAGDPNRPNLNPIALQRPYAWLMVDPNSVYSDFLSGVYSSRQGQRPTRQVIQSAPTMQVTATWGYATVVPYEIKTACIMQTARWYKRMQGTMADSLSNPEFGRVTYLQSLDPDIKHLLIDGRFIARQIG